MKFSLNFIIAFFLFISVSNGQFNSAFEEFLEETMIFLDEEINPVGLSISVRSGDKEWSRAIGISSVDDRLTTSSILAMGSITKTFTSAGILKLMEENRLTLSDPLYRYLPSFDNIDSTITIRELLNHTSGVHDYSFHRIIKEEILCAYKESLLTSSVGIVEKEEVEIYPNPAHDIISIKLPNFFESSLQIEVYNEIGTFVYAQKIQNNNQQTFQIAYFSELAKGFYFIKIFDKENSYTEKLIKM